MKVAYFLPVILLIASCKIKTSDAVAAVGVDTARLQNAGILSDTASTNSTQIDTVNTDSAHSTIIQAIRLSDAVKMGGRKGSAPYLLNGVLSMNVIFTKRKNELTIHIPYSLAIKHGSGGAVVQLQPAGDSIRLQPAGKDWGAVQPVPGNYENIYDAHNADGEALLQEKRIVLCGTNGATRVMPTDNFETYKYGQDLGNGFRIKNIGSAYNQYEIKVGYVLHTSTGSSGQDSSGGYSIEAVAIAIDRGLIK